MKLFKPRYQYDEFTDWWKHIEPELNWKQVMAAKEIARGAFAAGRLGRVVKPEKKPGRVRKFLKFAAKEFWDFFYVPIIILFVLSGITLIGISVIFFFPWALVAWALVGIAGLLMYYWHKFKKKEKAGYFK